jgi:hypothetical protein
VVIGLLLGLALAEAGTRAYLGLVPASGGDYVADADTGYRLLGGAGADTLGFGYVNRFGYRDREPIVPKPHGLRRVVGIGDSFVLGEVPPRENFLRVAERELAARGDGAPTEILMMGLGGYGPEQYVGVLRSSALAVDPDRVLLCFYVGNDVIGLPTRSRVRRGQLYPAGSAHRGLDLLRKSWLFGCLERSWAHRQRHDSRATGRPPDARPGLSAFYLSVLQNRLPTWERPAGGRISELWARAESRLDEFDRICRQRGLPWTLVLIPDEIQVDPSVREEALRRLRLDPARHDFEAPQRRLASWASDRGVAVLDLLPQFRARHAAEGPLYLEGNTHWNEAGNRVAGLAVAELLRGGTPR